MENGAVDRSNLELPPMNTILDELEVLEQHLRAEKIDIHMLEHFGQCVDNAPETQSSELSISKDQTDKAEHKRRQHRELSR